MPNPSRPATHPSGVVLALVLWAAMAPVPVHAQSGWQQSLPPEQVFRMRPGTADAIMRALSSASAGRAASAESLVGANATAAADTGTWELHDMPRRLGHALVFDSRRGRFLVVGGQAWRSPDMSVWSYDPAVARWSPLAPWMGSNTTAPRQFRGAVYDSLRDRVLVLTIDGSLELDALSLAGSPVWSHVWSGPASNGSVATLALDTRRDQLDLLGVWDATAQAHRLIRVPLLDPSTWTSELIAGEQPACVWAGSAVYDAARDSFVVMLSGNDYCVIRRLSAEGPPAWGAFAFNAWWPYGTPCALALDVALDRLMIVGDSRAAFSVSLADGGCLWLNSDGCGDTRPGSATAFDPRTRRLYYSVAVASNMRVGETTQPFISLNVDSGVVQGSWYPAPSSAASWLTEGPRGFGGHYWHTSVIDAAARQLVVFGGAQPCTLYPASNGMVLARSLDDSGGWTALGEASPTAPVVRFMQSTVYDPTHHALLLYGGQACDGSGAMPGDLWSLPLAPGGVWARIVAGGSGPPALRNCEFFYDAAHTRFLLMGGDNLSCYNLQAWELRLDGSPAWRPLAVSGSLGLPYASVFTDDARGDAWSVRYGGAVSHLTLGPDEIHGDDVTLIGEPPESWTPIGFDPVRRRIIAEARQGRYSCYNPGLLWKITLDDVPEIAPIAAEGAAPAARGLFASQYDPVGDRLWLTGGYDDNDTYFDDTWTLQLRPDQVTATLASLASAVADAGGAHLKWNVSAHAGIALAVERSADGTAWEGAGPIVDAGADAVSFDDATLAAGERRAYRLLATGGGATKVLGDAVWLTGPAVGGALALSPLANPSRGPLAVRLTLAPGVPAHLRLLDVGGRLVSEASVPAGATSWTFASPRVAGLYFAQVEQAGQRRSTRIVSAP